MNTGNKAIVTRLSFSISNHKQKMLSQQGRVTIQLSCAALAFTKNQSREYKKQRIYIPRVLTRESANCEGAKAEAKAIEAAKSARRSISLQTRKKRNLVF